VETCETQGLEERECTECNLVETNIIAATGHDSEWEETKHATCTAAAVESLKCKDCDHIEDIQDGDPALTHDMPPTWTVITDATCTVDGLESHTCTRDDCEHTVTRPIPATGCDHQWTVTTFATCLTPAEEFHKCTGCGDIDDVREGDPATGHNWTAWQTTTAETCTSAGLEARNCTHCLELETNPLAATGHDMPAEWTVGKPPSCVLQGVQIKECGNDCDYHITDMIPANEACGTCLDCDPPDFSDIRMIHDDGKVYLTNLDDELQSLIEEGKITIQWWRKVGDGEWVQIEVPPDRTWVDLVYDPDDEVTYKCDILIGDIFSHGREQGFTQPETLGNFWLDITLWGLTGIFAIAGLALVIVSFSMHDRKMKTIKA